MSKRNISAQDKINAVKRYLNGLTSQRILANEFSISQASIQQWITNYESMGEDAFLMKSYKHYSAELKRKAVLDYLSGKGSQTDICKKYGIRSKSKLQKWIKKYNGHEELKSSGTGGSIIMTKGRKTTFEERVEIVQYCIAHNHNYAETAENHRVSYQQARSYTIKYESGGVEALRDKRGKRKNPDEMNELESLRAEVKILRAEKERAEMEASFLKKLEEIERRRGQAWSVMNMYIRQSKTNTKNIIIPSLTFANSVEFLEQLTINGYIEKFQKTNEKTNELQMK